MVAAQALSHTLGLFADLALYLTAGTSVAYNVAPPSATHNHFYMGLRATRPAGSPASVLDNVTLLVYNATGAAALDAAQHATPLLNRSLGGLAVSGGGYDAYGLALAPGNGYYDGGSARVVVVNDGEGTVSGTAALLLRPVVTAGDYAAGG